MRIISYIKISLRTLFLHRGFSLLTLLGLSVGIAMSIFVLEYVFYQFSFDKHYERSEDVYRIVTKGRMENETVNAALAPMMLASRLDEYPSVEAVTRIIDVTEKTIHSNYATSFESDMLYADSAFFKVFSRPFLMGEVSGCLSDSSGVVISRSAATRLFGNRNPLGEELKINQDQTFVVKGVYQDVPENSHLQYDFVFPFSVVENQLRKYYGDGYSRMIESWFSLVCNVYVKLEPQTDAAVLEHELAADIRPEMEEEDRGLFSGALKTDLHFVFQRLDHIYLFSDQDFEIGKTTNPAYVFIFLGAAFFILLVTAFNFTNLTTARALDRAKEAGVRRMFGAKRFHLAGQFISESVLFSLMALFLGLVMVELLLPLFNQLFLIDFFDRSYRQSLDFPVVLIVALAVGMLSGIYPAYVFSRIKAYHLQSGYTKFSAYPGLWVRGVLVMVQVFVAVFVASTAIGMYRQLSFVNEKDPGFEIENLGLLERARHLGGKTDSVVHVIRNMDGVENLSKLYFNPGEPVSIMSFSHTLDSSKLYLFEVYPVDSSFFSTMGIEILEGSVDLMSGRQIAVNEMAAQVLGAQDVVGEKIITVAREARDQSEFEIRGVVADIVTAGWKNPVRPAVFVPAGKEDLPVSFAIRVRPDDWRNVGNALYQLWNHADTGVPFRAVSFTEKADSFYQEDYRYMTLALAFAVLVVIITTLGMTGLVSFLLATRQQGLLLRRITGFPDFHNIRTLFSGFFVFVAIGIFLALPVSLEMLGDWSRTFTVQYQTDYFCFLLPSVLMFSIAIGLATAGARRVMAGMSLHQF